MIKLKWNILTWKEVVVLTGESYELLTSIIKMMLEWEQDYRYLPYNFKVVVNSLNSYLIHHTNILPVKNIRGFIGLLKRVSICDLGFELDDDILNSTFIDESGHINANIRHWYETSIERDDVDQLLVREFLLECRNEYKNTGNSEIFKMYSKVRAFVNPSNYCITNDKLMSLIGRYPGNSDIIVKILEWYEPVKLKIDKNYVCPVCGKLLDNDILKENRCTDMCMYYRDKDYLLPQIKQTDKDVKYKKLKRGIYTYTLLPGISELRIFDRLCENFGEEKVTLYPEIDKFDIAITFDNRRVLVDVKDFASPHELVDMLIEKQMLIKMEGVAENDYVYLVIPEHRKHLYKGGNYKNIVKKKLRHLTKQVLVAYEDELFKEVEDIINESY